MNIAIFGGTFDPPHFGHVLVARQVLEFVPAIDEVWLVPDNTNPDKKVYAGAADRLAMTRLLVEPRIKVSDIDILRGGETYTVDTVRDLMKNKDNQYHLLLGSDLLPQMGKWQGYEEIVKSAPCIIFPRPEYSVGDVPASFTVLPENKLLLANYSSTIIRDRVGRGLSIEGLVPHSVAEYINKHKLYQSKSVYV